MCHGRGAAGIESSTGATTARSARRWKRGVRDDEQQVPPLVTSIGEPDLTGGRGSTEVIHPAIDFGCEALAFRTLLFGFGCMRRLGRSPELLCFVGVEGGHDHVLERVAVHAEQSRQHVSRVLIFIVVTSTIPRVYRRSTGEGSGRDVGSARFSPSLVGRSAEGLRCRLLELDLAREHAVFHCWCSGLACVELRHHLACEQLEAEQMSSWVFLPAWLSRIT